jgi:hypothetical protein
MIHNVISIKSFHVGFEEAPEEHKSRFVNIIGHVVLKFGEMKQIIIS